MLKNLERTRRRGVVGGVIVPRYRRLACEWLEDRRMLSLGDLLQTVSSPTPKDGSEFPHSVAAWGSTVVVGAPYDDAGAGSAYIFDATTGTLLHTLNNPTPVAGDGFGASVSVLGNMVVVGAPSDSARMEQSGAAYIFDAATGSLLHTLKVEPNELLSYMYPNDFGFSVAVSENTVVVGAPNSYLYFADFDTWEYSVGAAYLFDAGTGELLDILYNPRDRTNLGADDYVTRFGHSVSVSGSTVVVGTPYDLNWTAGTTNYGSAYMYSLSGALLHTLNNPTPEYNECFGDSVFVSGSTVVVGTAGDDDAYSDSGSAYIYDAGTGSLLRTLNNPTPAAGDGFGASVSVSGNMVVVGAPFEDTGALNTGSAYIFDTGTGNLLSTLNNPMPAADDGFGDLVAVSGSRVVVVAPEDDSAGRNAGSFYVFDSTAGNTSASLIGDDLLILDDAPGGKNDCLSISLDTAPSPDELVIRDPSTILGAHNIPGVIGEGTDTLRVPANAFGGQIIVSTSWGDDTLTVDFSDGSPLASAGLVYHGGADGPTGDHLQVAGLPGLSAVYRPDGILPGSGSVEVFDGSTSQCLVITGAESVDVSAMQDVVLETPNGADAVTLEATEAGSVVPGNLLRTLNNPTPAASDRFGRSVSISGNTMVVGAPYDDTGAGNAGSAYVFDTATGSLLRTLRNPSPPTGDVFGYSVAVSGGTVVVGAPYDDAGAMNAGSAYIFDTATGNLLYTLNNPTPASSEYFGYSVAVSGTTVVIGAIYDDDAGATDAGSAYIFDAATGTLLHTLNNPTPLAGDGFGASVSVSGNMVVVGAPFDDTGATNAGSVHIFKVDTGNLVHTLTNPTPAAYDEYGTCVSVSGDTMVVGAHLDDTGAENAGSAYVFGTATGSLLYTVNNPTPASYDRFGSSVSVSGGTVVVGAPYDDTGANAAGSAVIFDTITGTLLHSLRNPSPASGDVFGYSVAVSGGTVVVGAPYDDAGATDDGSAYVFGNLVRTLNNPTPAASDNFGRSAAVSGNTVVIGAPYDDTLATDAGAAYLFDAATGMLLGTLNNPRPTAGDHFGSSVAVSDNTVVVGAPYDDAGAMNTGSAYVFDVATGSLLYTLNNPGPDAWDDFGSSVAVSGTTVVIGAHYDDHAGALNAGSAYVFDAATGSLLRTLSSPTPTASDLFGSSVAVSGSTVVVGATHVDTGATDAGSAYIYDAGTGSLLRTLNNPTPASGDGFGASVSVSGNMVVVGATFDDTGALNTGSAYLFDATTGNLRRTLNNPAPARYDRFGYSVAVSGTTVVIGAYLDDYAGATNAGSAYLFDFTTGSLVGMLTRPTPRGDDQFGYSVSVSESTVVVGAHLADNSEADVGSAFVFDANRVDATTISGTSGGVGFASLTVYDVGKMILDLDADPTAISNHDELRLEGDYVARGLQSIEVYLGTGTDEVELAGVVDLGTGGQFRATGEVVSLTGTGTLHTQVTGVDRIEATGPLTLGSGGAGGFNFPGTLIVGTHTVTLNVAGLARLGELTTIEGGTLAAPNGVALPTGSTLERSGTVAGRVAAQLGSTIFATGTLTLGDDDSYAGFFSDGELYVGLHVVTIHDRNQGVLGSLTEIGDASGPGTLSAPNGLLLENSKVLCGYGVVNNEFESQGYVMGEGPLPEDELEFTGLVTGAGDFDGNILFSGGYSPGNSPAEIDFGGNVTFGPAATLYVEIGGPLAGADYDFLDVAGQAELGGSIVVSLIRGYVPAVGDTFQVIAAEGGIMGSFTNQSLPELPPDRVWDVDFSSGVATVIDAPPAVDIVDVTPDPRTTAVATITILFSEAVTGFDLVDLTLQRDGGGNLLTAAQTLTSSDNVTWQLGNLADLTSQLGTYVLTLSAAGSGITDLSGIPLVDDAQEIWTMHSAIAGRHIFYNRSVWDGNNGAANAADDGAIATEKTALLPGQTATFANYTSYDKGLNGLMIDVHNLAGTPTLSDFTFKVGNSNDPSTWAVATPPTGITVRAGAGDDDSDRVTFIWADGVIRNCWLQVTVRATDHTGLADKDVFYVGTAVGEAGNAATDALVNATDEIGARNNPHSPFNPAQIYDPYDYNRDKLVNATDQILARNNRTNPFTALRLITPPLQDGDDGEGEAVGGVRVDGLTGASPSRDRLGGHILIGGGLEIPAGGAWSTGAPARVPVLLDRTPLTASALAHPGTCMPWEGQEWVTGVLPAPVVPAGTMIAGSVDVWVLPSWPVREWRTTFPLAARMSTGESSADTFQDPARDDSHWQSQWHPEWHPGTVGPLDADRKDGLTRRLDWVSDERVRRAWRAVDEALEELLAEWEEHGYRMR